MSERREPPRLSIVVLPFANIGGDPEQDYFVDGVTDSLTADLSRIRGAFVIGRSTAFTYKGKGADVRQIGRDLNVRYCVWPRFPRGSARCAAPYRPSISIRFCTAAPDAPLPRLSNFATSKACPRASFG
jgi:TolB-like protein